MLRRIVVVSACCSLVAGAAVAIANDQRAETRVGQTKVVKTPDGYGHYSGKVKSEEGKCRKRRDVKLIHLSDPPFVIGMTETDADGFWELNGALPPAASERIKIVVSGNRDCEPARKVYELKDVLQH